MHPGFSLRSIPATVVAFRPLARSASPRQVRRAACYDDRIKLAQSCHARRFGRKADGGDALVLQLQSGARLRIEPWDSDVFTVRFAPVGPFAAVAESLDPRPVGFVQLQMDKEGKLGLFACPSTMDSLRLPPRVGAANRPQEFPCAINASSSPAGWGAANDDRVKAEQGRRARRFGRNPD